MGQTSVSYFINTPSELDYVLYSSGIDPDLAPQHHIPPGSYASVPTAAPRPKRQVCDISSRLSSILDL